MSEFDNDLKVGDICTTYYSGLFRVTGIERRFHTENELKYYGNSEWARGKKPGDEYKSSIEFVEVAKKDGTLTKTKTPRPRSCDASYCRKIDEAIVLA